MELFDHRVFEKLSAASLLQKGDRVIVACSGGVDSVALLHYLVSRRDQWGIEVAAIHVDHMLRAEESMADGDLVSTLCETYQIPFFGGKVPVPAILKEQGGNLQAICREGRYAYFETIMQIENYNVLATAHHADDQLETLFMQVTKGIVPTGIPGKRRIGEGILIRPFLTVSKNDLYAYSKQYNLPYREDPSNESEDYVRNRYRKHVIPHVLEENPKAAYQSDSIARQLQEEDAFLFTLAKEHLEQILQFSDEGLPWMEQHHFLAVPTALQRRLITLLLNYLYDQEKHSIPIKFALIDQIHLHGTSNFGSISLHLPQGYLFLREYGKLSFIREQLPLQMNEPQMLQLGEKIELANGQWMYWSEIHKQDENLLMTADEKFYFNLTSSALPLYMRRRREGDRILLTGMHQPKKVSRLFIDEKVPQAIRDQLPMVVTAQDEICLIPTIRHSQKFSRMRFDEAQYIFAFGKRV